MQNRGEVLARKATRRRFIATAALAGALKELERGLPAGRHRRGRLPGPRLDRAGRDRG